MIGDRKQRSIRCKECGEILYYDVVKISDKVWRTDRKAINAHYVKCLDIEGREESKHKENWQDAYNDF